MVGGSPVELAVPPGGLEGEEPEENEMQEEEDRAAAHPAFNAVPVRKWTERWGFDVTPAIGERSWT